MIKTLANLFTPRPSNNYKAKTLHLSSLSFFLLIIMASQVLMTFVGRTIPGVLGIASNITAEELIELTNQQRQQHGLPELKLNPVLVEAATQKAADMIAKNYWAHTAPDGRTPWYFFKHVNYKYLYAGENLARDFIDSQSIISAWMKSPTHRDNILSGRYRDIGIAVIHDTFQGQQTTLVVQLFGTEVNTVLPVKTGQVDRSAETVALAELDTNGKIAGWRYYLPLIDSFSLTKAVSISLTLILLAVIVIDSFIIVKKKIIRLSSKSLAHLAFLGILLVVLLIIQQGIIL
jgi:uncharacterized protein YkwD